MAATFSVYNSILHGDFYVLAVGLAQSGELLVHLMRNVQSKTMYVIHGINKYIGNNKIKPGVVISCDKVQILNQRFIKKKVFGIHSLLEITNANTTAQFKVNNEVSDNTDDLEEFSTYPNNSSMVKLLNINDVFEKKDIKTNFCALAKAVTFRFKVRSSDNQAHLVLELMNGNIKCNAIQWKFSNAGDNAVNPYPTKSYYLLWNINCNYLNDRPFIALNNKSIIFYDFCDRYFSDIDSIASQWHSLNLVSKLWYSNGTRNLIKYTFGNVMEAQNFTAQNINTKVAIEMNNVEFDNERWSFNPWIRHKCNSVIKYMPGSECYKNCTEKITESTNYWLLSKGVILDQSGPIYTTMNDEVFITLINECITKDLTNNSIQQFADISHFKDYVFSVRYTKHIMDILCDIEEAVTAFFEQNNASIKLTLYDNGQGGDWNQKYCIEDISFTHKNEIGELRNNKQKQLINIVNREISENNIAISANTNVHKQHSHATDNNSQKENNQVSKKRKFDAIENNSNTNTVIDNEPKPRKQKRTSKKQKQISKKTRTYSKKA